MFLPSFVQRIGPPWGCLEAGPSAQPAQQESLRPHEGRDPRAAAAALLSDLRPGGRDAARVHYADGHAPASDPPPFRYALHDDSIGLLGGFWLDKKLDTLPIFTLGGVVLGTVLAFYGTYKMVLPLLDQSQNSKKGDGRR